MDTSAQLVQVTAFDAARIRAIDAYGTLEFHLVLLLSVLLNTELSRASVILTSVVNSRSRNRILTEFLKIEHGTTYLPFWRQIDKNIRTLDQIRNNIVHWTAVMDMGDIPSTKNQEIITLQHPRKLIGQDSEREKLSLKDLQDFIQNCNKTSSHILAFYFLFRDYATSSEASRDIFRQPPGDQTLNDFLHIRYDAKEPSPPPPSSPP